MEALAPSLKCILEIQGSLKGGCGVKTALWNYVRRNDDSFSQQVFEWLRLKEQGGPAKEYRDGVASVYRKTLLSIFDMGLEGLPIIERLEEIEGELLKVSRSELDQYIKRLPFLSLLPLLCFQLPALLLIVLSPVLDELFRGLNS